MPAAPQEESIFPEPVMEHVATVEGVLSEGVCTVPFRVALGEAPARGSWKAGLLGVHTTEDFAVTREAFAAFAAEGSRRTR